MQSRKDRWQEDLFVASPLRDLIPEDHILKRVDAILDLSWLHDEVRECYCQDNGWPSIDPESALRLMLAGFFQGIVQDRKLMREAQVNLAIRWFAGYRLDEALPERSSLTRIRQRWGAPLFRRIFERTVAQCVEAGLVTSDTVHIDATLIRADVSWDSLTTRHVEQVVECNEGEMEERVHGRAKTQHGLARAVRRGLDNVATQAYLTAIVMNLKKLAATHPAADAILNAAKRLTARLRRSWTPWRQNKTDTIQPTIHLHEIRPRT